MNSTRAQLFLPVFSPCVIMAAMTRAPDEDTPVTEPAEDRGERAEK